MGILPISSCLGDVEEMATYRKHHYVPRFYLRNFAATGGRSIHLFNIPSSHNVLNASLRNQCYSSHFYGDDPIIEHALAGIEGATATVIRDILMTKRLPTPRSVDHYTLMTFTMTQRARTQMSAVTTDAMTDGMLKAAYRGDPRIKDLDIEGLKIGFKNSVLLPLRVSARMVPVTFDLQLHLLVNHTETQFITSDNPVVLHNTHCQEITIRSCTGWGCAGLEVFLPLSPEVCLYAYDAAVYKVASRRSTVTLVSPRDVLQLNRLQWINALENVYYASNECSGIMARESAWAKPRRATEYIRIKEATAEDDENDRLIHAYTPGLNMRVGLSCSSVRRRQRNVPEDRRGKPRPAVQEYIERNAPPIPPGIGERRRTFRVIN